MEFSSVTYDNDFPNYRIKSLAYDERGSFGLLPGQWTDDASMGACVADSLLCRGGFDPADMKVRFVNWWNYGYNNSSRLSDYHQHSVGLGGNISMSFGQFSSNGTVYTSVGDRNTSGNGSLMRNGACAVYYWDDPERGIDVARRQSYLTHQGIEAAETCGLLTHIVSHCIRHPKTTKEEALTTVCEAFAAQAVVPSVAALAKSMQEPDGNPDRNWPKRAETYHYSPGRSRLQPGYVGSYAMDALAMALHCVWSTNDFESALLKAANRCGDADSVTDVTGQIAGAIYGYGGIPPSWIPVLQRWDGGDYALKAFKMFHKRSVRASTAEANPLPPHVVVPLLHSPAVTDVAPAPKDDDDDDAPAASSV
jgi:ADP-ribosylglycohydrolase